MVHDSKISFKDSQNITREEYINQCKYHMSIFCKDHSKFFIYSLKKKEPLNTSNPIFSWLFNENIQYFDKIDRTLCTVFREQMMEALTEEGLTNFRLRQKINENNFIYKLLSSSPSRCDLFIEPQ
jgi:hypothetical protein